MLSAEFDLPRGQDPLTESTWDFMQPSRRPMTPLRRISQGTFNIVTCKRPLVDGLEAHATVENLRKEGLLIPSG